jgi:hypothetical protein
LLDDAISRATVPLVKRTSLILLGLAVAAAALATFLFPRAFPVVAITDRIERSDALQRADSILRLFDLAPDSAKRAIQFVADDSLRTYIELAGGGKDTLDALLRERDAALYSWQIRAFVPGESREARIRLAADGRLIGVRRTLPDTLVRPTLEDSAARRIADSVLVTWLDEPAARWQFVSSSYSTRPRGRIDRTYTFERADRRVAGAPLRLEMTIGGDLVTDVGMSVDIPESFGDRYDEMRSANNLLSLLSMFGVLALMVVAVVSLRSYSQRYAIRWREPLIIGGIGGLLAAAALLNQLPAAWFSYDTAGSAALHQAMGAALALLGGAGTMLLLAVTLAAAESLTRQAFPWHIDWWRYWKYRGTREVAGRVGGGYAAAALGFAYVTTFYLVARGAFGWWVPSQLIDDPNQIATPLPWVAGIALSLQAAVSEEALFRAIPLSIIALWASTRDDRDRWMAAGIVATALLFGFAHSDYPSWPPWSRGIEIFLEACVWGVLFLRFGILVPVIAHFIYDLVLFGLFATAGSGVQYRVSSVILLLALLAPALSVAWAVWRQRGWVPLGTDAWFEQAVLKPAIVNETPSPVVHSATPVGRMLDRRLRPFALGIPVLAVLAALAWPAPRLAGPPFTVAREDVVAVADSMIRDRGLTPDSWHRLARPVTDTTLGLRRFVRQHHADSLLEQLSGTYAIPAWWLVRYVRPDAALEQRTEEWRARVLPDGRPLDVRHVVPEADARQALPADSLRAAARRALAVQRFDTTTLYELEFTEVPRPGSDGRDVTITYVDSSVALPAGAMARAIATFAGDELLWIRRAIELPESFVRQARSDDQKQFVLIGALGFPAFILVIWGIVRSRKAPFIATADLAPARAAKLVSVLMIATVGGSLLALPGDLASYDTAVPWRTFLTSTLLGQLMSLVSVAVFVLFWLLANGMRKRAGIPLVSGSSGGAVSDDVTAGLALGGTPLVTAAVARWFIDHSSPAFPSTDLNALAPMLVPIADLLPAVVGVVLAVAIPSLALYNASSIPGVRRAVTTLFLVLTAGILIGVRHAAGLETSLASAGWELAAGLMFVAAVITWGRVSVLTWFIAAVFHAAVQQVIDARHAPTGIESVGHTIGLAGALALLVLLLRISRTRAVVRPDVTSR